MHLFPQLHDADPEYDRRTVKLGKSSISTLPVQAKIKKKEKTEKEELCHQGPSCRCSVLRNRTVRSATRRRRRELVLSPFSRRTIPEVRWSLKNGRLVHVLPVLFRQVLEVIALLLEA
jgi:hypothetical protein